MTYQQIQEEVINQYFEKLGDLIGYDLMLDYMYMGHEKKGVIGNRTIYNYRFKNRDTREYITMIEAYRTAPGGEIYDTQYTMKEGK